MKPNPHQVKSYRLGAIWLLLTALLLSVIGCNGGKSQVSPTTLTEEDRLSNKDPISSMVARFGDLLGEDDIVISNRLLEQQYDIELHQQLLKEFVTKPIGPNATLWFLGAPSQLTTNALTRLDFTKHDHDWILPQYSLLSYTITSAPAQISLPSGVFDGEQPDLLELGRIDLATSETTKWWGQGEVSVASDPDTPGNVLKLTCVDSAAFAMSPMLNVKGATLLVLDLEWKGDPPAKRITPNNIFGVIPYKTDAAGERVAVGRLPIDFLVEPTPAFFSNTAWTPLRLFWVLPADCQGARLVIGFNYPQNTLMIDKVRFSAIDLEP